MALRFFRILQYHDVLVVNVGHISERITVRKNAFVSLVQYGDPAQFELVRLQCVEDVGMKHYKFGLVSEIADDDRHVLLRFERAAGTTKDSCQFLQECWVVMDVA